MRKTQYKRWLSLALSTVAFTFSLSAGAAYPDHSIRLIVGSNTGGGGDTVARLMAEAMSARLGVSIIVENRPGASGNIGAAAVARADPDGYTLLFAYSGHVINPGLFKDMPFDTVHDLRAVGKLGSPQSVLVVHPSVPANNLQEFIKLVKSKPDYYAVAALFGTDQYVAAKLLAKKEDMQMLFVPYKGNAAALNDLLSGQVNAMVNTVGASTPFIKAGKLKPLAIVNRTRSALIPDVPTLAEQGVPDVVSAGWYGMIAPAGVKDEVINKLADAVKASLADPEVVKRLRDFGVEPEFVPPREFDRFIASEVDRWKTFFKENGIAPQ